MVVGFDVDGVLSDFERIYAKQFPNLNFPFHDPTFPAMWEWPQHYGATTEEVDAVWDRIRASGEFWLGIRPYPNTPFQRIEEFSQNHSVYFVTARVGVNAQRQTQEWLTWQGISMPSVIVVESPSLKAPIIDCMGFDAFIDDKPRTVESLGTKRPKMLNFLMNRPWNAVDRVKGIRALCVNTVDQMLDLLEEVE